jgi:hypothetical protein
MSAEISFVLTEQDYADSARSQYWQRISSPRRWAWPLLALAALFSLFAYSVSCDFRSFVYNLVPYAVIVLVLCPLLCVVGYWWAGRYARRIFRQQAAQPESRIAWNDEGLRVESAIGSLNAKWSDFYGWRKARGTYMIHMNEMIYYLIPARAISPEQAADLEATLSRSGLAQR